MSKTIETPATEAVDLDQVDRLLRLSAKFERALRQIAELDYTRAAVNCCATTAHQIATDALSNVEVSDRRAHGNETKQDANGGLLH